MEFGKVMIMSILLISNRKHCFEAPRVYAGLLKIPIATPTRRLSWPNVCTMDNRN